MFVPSNTNVFSTHPDSLEFSSIFGDSVILLRSLNSEQAPVFRFGKDVGMVMEHPMSLQE